MLALDIRSGERPPAVLGRQVNVWHDDTGRVCARFFADGDRRWVEWPGLGIFAFRTSERSVRFWPSSASIASIAETFERVLQPAILQALGWQALHASAVVGPDGGAIAICGVKHSG